MKKDPCLTDMRGKRVAGLFSAGLDSVVVCRSLKEAGAYVDSYTAYMGQIDEEDPQDMLRRMKIAGADNAYLIDARELYCRFMLQVLQGDGRYQEDYPNFTGVGRAAIVAAIMPYAKKSGADYISHGATGKGNDQIRFELHVAALARGIRVYAPHRDPIFKAQFPGRQQMIDYCQLFGLEIKATKDEPYSNDANLNITYEAGELEKLTTPTLIVKPALVTWPMDAPDKMEKVTIRVFKGRPTSINGKRMSLVDIFLALNQIAGRNGIGITDMVEDRRIGGKSRGVYEGPGTWMVHHVLKKLRQINLSRERKLWFEHCALRFGQLVYDGEWFSDLSKDMLAYVASVANDLSGTVTFGLYKGNIFFLGAKSGKGCLYCPELLSMEALGDFNEADSQGMLNILRKFVDLQREAGQTRIKF